MKVFFVRRKTFLINPTYIYIQQEPFFVNMYSFSVQPFLGQFQGDGLDSSKFLKGTLLKTFYLIIFQKFHNSNFSNVLLKICEEIFFRSVQLIKWFHYRPFSGKLSIILEYSKETFFLESAFADVRNSELQGGNIREKNTLSQIYFQIFRNFRTPFLSQHSRNVSVVQCGSRLQNLILQATLIKGNSTRYFYLTIFRSFRCSKFKISVMEFSRVLDCTPQSCFVLKNNSNRDNTLKFLEVEFSPLKVLWWSPILVATSNICENRLVHRRCPSGYCENIVFKARSYGLRFQ